MKKAFGIISLIILFIIMYGCYLESTITFDSDFLNKVTDIQIIKILKSGDIGDKIEYEVIKKIDEEDEQEFLQEFSKVKYKMIFGEPDFFEVDNIYIKLDFNNSTYGVYGETFLGDFDQYNNLVTGWSRYDSNDIIENLISEYI